MNNEILNILLKDRTTEKNILWANGEHSNREIQAEHVDLIRPRHEKLRAHQKQRTRDRAEIFTPPDICRLQNDVTDTAWLRNIVTPWLKDSYKLEDDSSTAKAIIDGDFEKIAAAWFGQSKIFPAMPDAPADTVVANWLAENETLWQTYVTSPRLEITCGEAPYLVSRYNAVTGEAIPLAERSGLLDRKLRLVNAETKTLNDWTEWALRAVESVYGYDFQGDNLFLARRNVFDTVVEYFAAKFDCKPPQNFWRKVADVISWNLWQMDGLTGSPPFQENANLFGGANCKIIDWRTREVVEFASCR